MCQKWCHTLEPLVTFQKSHTFWQKSAQKSKFDLKNSRKILDKSQKVSNINKRVGWNKCVQGETLTEN